MRVGKRRQKQSGFTYLTVLFLIVLAGVVLARIGIDWSQAGKREKELELLFIGNAYRQAIKLYYDRTPGMIKRYPATLEDLLSDKRYNPPQHYLRKRYLEPILNRSQWGIIAAPEGGVMGIHSLSNEHPIKTVGFDKPNISFEGAVSYSDWEFTYMH